MAEYDSARALARRLIDTKGRDLILRTVADGTLPDSAQPWDPADTKSTTDTTVRGVVVPASREFQEGSLVRVAEKTAYIAASPSATGSDISISQKDLIIDGGRAYRIVEFNLLAPGEQDVLYTLQLRGQ